MKNPGRKIYHVLGGSGLLSLNFFLGRPLVFYAYAALLAIVLFFDIARFARPRFNAWAMTNLSSLLRPAEAGKLNGSAPYILGAALTILLFPQRIAVPAILFLVLGDVSATTVGEGCGRTKIGGKSLEGTAAFLLVALLAGAAARALALGPGAPAIVAGAVTAALVELFLPRWANDNLLIPPVSALAMMLVETMR